MLSQMCNILSVPIYYVIMEATTAIKRQYTLILIVLRKSILNLQILFKEATVCRIYLLNIVYLSYQRQCGSILSTLLIKDGPDRVGVASK